MRLDFTAEPPGTSGIVRCKVDPNIYAVPSGGPVIVGGQLPLRPRSRSGRITRALLG